MKKLIVYDLDGTLVDTKEDIVLGVNHMLKTLEKPELEADEIETYVAPRQKNTSKKDPKYAKELKNNIVL